MNRTLTVVVVLSGAAVVLAAGLDSLHPIVGTSTIFHEFHQFQKAGKGSTNFLQGQLGGSQVYYLSNQIFLVKQVRLEHYQPSGRTNLVAHAPQCFFDNKSRVAWSTGRLEILGMDGGLSIVGNEGFQAHMTNSSLYVSNRVRTVLRQ